MEGQIAHDAFAQYGALAFVAVSGWVVAWFVWRALDKARTDLTAALTQAKIDAESRHERTLAALTNNTQALTVLAERLRGGGS